MVPALKPFVCRLPSRSLLRASGRDAHEFLQGLCTADMRLLQPGGSSWGCFLYLTGRVMCDAYFYQARDVDKGKSAILIDVHADMAAHLKNHMEDMRMRKKVIFEDVSGQLAVVASALGNGGLLGPGSPNSGGGGDDITPSSARAEASALAPDVAWAKGQTFLDPRSRIILPPATGAASATPDASQLVLEKTILPVAWAPPPSSSAAYDELLLQCGVGEGPAVFKNNKTLPFEANVDYLHGVSYDKGCYIGQELTHRTHVMLVTRRRSVPLQFMALSESAAVGKGLFVAGGGAAPQKIGEISAISGTHGLGVVRLRYVEKESLTIPGLMLEDGTSVAMRIPEWWPRKEVRKLLKNNE